MSTFSKGIVFYTVNKPIYKPYKELSSPIIRAAAKRLRMDGVTHVNIEFLQEDGTEVQSFHYIMGFSLKNVEAKLAELFEEFSPQVLSL